eukprot:snap_masked-scaffold_12-processed-gene-4.33-mRNA-1 protein AED:1.00 eAED:1.00 QI:0/0/0/0/1/1/3/0/217
MTVYKIQKRITSKDVFDSFTYRNEINQLMYENIISRECYQVWLQSRSSKLKYPEDAYRKTVYAHIRGADTRSPFEKDVKQSLLKKLRAVNKEGVPIDSFGVVFGHSKRFRRNNKGGWCAKFEYPYGYHEKKQNRIMNGTLVENQENLEKLLHISKEQMNNYKKETKKVSFHFSFPAVGYLVNLLSEQSYFFSPDFILLKPEEQHFKQNCILFFYFIL